MTSSILLLFTFSLLLGQTQGASNEAQAVLDDVSTVNNQSLLWGPYRSNLYFGVKPRIPKSLSVGLMWVKVEDFTTVAANLRDTCEQSEDLAGYGWDEYDIRTGGRQTIHDKANQVDITTEFVKIPGGEHGGSWAVRVKGVPREERPDLKTTLLLHISSEGQFSDLQVTNKEPGETGAEGTVTLEGQSQGLGNFKIDITRGPDSNMHPIHKHPSNNDKPLDKTLVHSLQIPEDGLWQTKPILFSSWKHVIETYIAKYGQTNAPPPWQMYTISHRPGTGNMHLIQKVFMGAFEFDVLFSSGSATEPVTSDVLTERIDKVTKDFSKRYLDVLKPQAPFTSAMYDKFSKSMFSNLVGGIGYFYGDSIVDRSYAPEYEEENEGFWEEAAQARARHQEKPEGPFELFTAIPSRPFFPRGFLWDEGFHLLPIVDWDIDLTLDIVRSWFNLMDDDGWIAREQILGPEARSKVPAEFQVQYPHYANPPTLFFVIDTLLDKLTSKTAATKGEKQDDVYNKYLEPNVAKKYLLELYPLLKRHYFWFRKTQKGDIKSYDREAYSTKEAYRWRGRTDRHILPSGLDDYPRASPPHPGELHVDLISWVGMMSRTLKRVATELGEKEDATEFAGHETAILRNIEDLHWDKIEKVYCDATIDDYEEDVHVCHKGYVSIFPFLLGLLPADSPRIGDILDVLYSPRDLWSKHGIRSLAFQDELYGTGENYWRSPVWINMNYLALRELLNLATSKGPFQTRAADIYSMLRVNVVQTVFQSWEETGFAWEQYNPETGRGQRTQHFTGWTSLVIKIMAMPDLGGKTAKDEL